MKQTPQRPQIHLAAEQQSNQADAADASIVSNLESINCEVISSDDDDDDDDDGNNLQEELIDNEQQLLLNPEIHYKKYSSIVNYARAKMSIRKFFRLLKFWR